MMIPSIHLFFWIFTGLTSTENPGPQFQTFYSPNAKTFAVHDSALKSKESNTSSKVVADALKITYYGKGYFPVEMDGYGVEKNLHYPIRPKLPYVSPDLPEYYIRNGSPVAYLIGSVPEIQLECKLSIPLSGKGILKGRSKNIDFKGEVLLKSGSFKAEFKSTKPLPEFIDCWENEEINWELQFNNKVYELGITRNSIYTILRNPRMALLHTALNISAMAARGLTDTLEVSQRIWQLFQNRNIYRARDQQPLSYYKLYEDKAPAELRGMLMAGSGQCVAWSYLLYAALGAQGISCQIILVAPPGKGRLYVRNWKFIKGDLFIHSGQNGISETKAVGDDIQIIERGKGQPYAPIWKASPLVNDSIGGDDKPGYSVGQNGLVDTKINERVAIPTIPYGFGLPNQRAYVIKSEESVNDVRLGGDDIIEKQATSYFVLTGPNGILETGMQDVFIPGKDGKPHPFVSWEPQVGRGTTHINFQYAISKVQSFSDAKGDDVKYEWWVNSGKNGVSETPGCNTGKGKSYSVSVEAGEDRIINTKPAGDDSIIDLREYFKNAPKGHTYIYPFNMWAEPGVVSQNNETPPTDYPNHVIVKIGEKYYDPSYGTGPFDSQLEWEKASIAGVGIQMRDKDNNFIRFDNKIMFFVKPVQEFETVTSFIKMLSPN